MMITPNSRREFERNLDLLAESIEKGTFQIPPFPRTINGLLNARQLPNVRSNFLTIDESTRLLANSIANFDRPEFNFASNAEQSKGV